MILSKANTDFSFLAYVKMPPISIVNSSFQINSQYIGLNYESTTNSERKRTD